MAGTRLLVLVAAALMAASCGTAQPWAAPAHAWTDAFVAAHHQEAETLASFLAPDVVWHTLHRGLIHGRAGYVEVAALEDGSFGEVLAEPRPLGRDLLALVQDDRVSLLTIRSQGLLERVDLAPAPLPGAPDGIPLDAWGTPRPPTDEAALEIARQYLKVWNDADVQALHGLYAPHAVVVDSLDQRVVDGTDGILAEARRPRPTLVPDGRSPSSSTYPRPTSWGHGLDGVWLLLATREPCPDRHLVVLDLDAFGRVDVERRLHDVASVESCGPPGGPEQGWWVGRRLPVPLGERQTGVVDSPAGPIEVYNGSTDLRLEVMVSWAVRLFVDAGIGAPPVASVRFDPFDARCLRNLGYAEWTDGSADILVCADERDIAWQVAPDPHCLHDGCVQAPPGRRHLVVHELAHAWMVEHVDAREKDAFLRLHGLSTWDDEAMAWSGRGIEVAAETLAWGLMAEPYGLFLSVDPDCERLAAGFEVLTGRAPVATCPG